MNCVLDDDAQAVPLEDDLNQGACVVVRSGVYTVQSVVSAKYLNLWRACCEDGALVKMWGSHVDAGSKWRLNHLENDVYTIQSVLSRKYLHLWDRTPSDGAMAKMRSAIDIGSKWRIRELDDGL